MIPVSKDLLHNLVKEVEIDSATSLGKQTEMPSGPADFLTTNSFSSYKTTDEELVSNWKAGASFRVGGVNSIKV